MNERFIIFTVRPITDVDISIYTEDTRVNPEDREVVAGTDKLIQAMTMISEVLNDEGYAVLFEVD